MAAPLPLADQSSITEQLLAMGFEAKYIDEALNIFEKEHGDDYNAETIIELTMQLKNQETQIVEQISNHNKQIIGTQLYYQIYSIEPTLASKITGMMLQWNTNKLMKLLSNPSQLLQTIQAAKSALDDVLFKPHMDLIIAENLRVGEKIDFRNKHGKYILSTVIRKHNTILVIHFDGLADLFDTFCDYKQELHRFALAGSISARTSHRLQQLSVGDMVDFKFFNNWTCGKITQLDSNSGQIEVMFEHQDTAFIQWTHRDNTNEVSMFRTKHEYVDISTDLLGWKALETDPDSSNQFMVKNVENVFLLNNNEIIVIRSDRIYKYIINLNKWVNISDDDWRHHSPPNFTTCCLSEDKHILYILSTFESYDGTYNYITQFDLLTFKYKRFEETFPYNCIPHTMLMVDDTIHFIAYDRMERVAKHFSWNTFMKHPKLEYIFDNLTIGIPYTEHFTQNMAFIYCKQRNIIVLFGHIFNNNLFVYSLKQNKWCSRNLQFNELSTPFKTLFSFALTNDEKYVMIFAGTEYKLRNIFLDKLDQVGKIFLLDIMNSKLIGTKNDQVNILLQNLATSMKSEYGINSNCKDSRIDKLWYPIIINKTTILIDAFLNNSNFRFVPHDIASIIKTYYGYDNDELYLYCAYNGYLWNVKVTEIIKHKLPKLKFCTDPQILKQEQQRIMLLKNQLLKKHNDLTAQVHNYHVQQQTMYQQPQALHQQQTMYQQTFGTRQSLFGTSLPPLLPTRYNSNFYYQ